MANIQLKHCTTPIQKQNKLGNTGKFQSLGTTILVIIGREVEVSAGSNESQIAESATVSFPWVEIPVSLTEPKIKYYR